MAGGLVDDLEQDDLDDGLCSLFEDQFETGHRLLRMSTIRWSCTVNPSTKLGVLPL